MTVPFLTFSFGVALRFHWGAQCARRACAADALLMRGRGQKGML
jgi:hypothetical protein